MSMSPQRAGDRIAKVVKAWSNLRPTKSFGGMTLEEFKAAVTPSLDARAALVELDDKSATALVQRDNADRQSLPLVLCVVDSVIGDLQEGRDGELYKAMGFVRKSERASGLTRANRANATTPKAA